MKILVRPIKGPNPRNSQLYDHINATAGVVAEEFTFAKALTSRFDILHIHWPDRIFYWKMPTSMSLLALFVLFAVARLRKAKVVYTCHNIFPKNNVTRAVFRWYIRIMRFGVDWVISPRQDLVRHIQRLYPKAQIRVVPLGILAVPKLRDDRIFAKVFGNDMPKTYMLIPGVQERTKQTEVSISQILAIWPEVDLLIAGPFPDVGYLDQLRAQFADAPKVRFYNAFLAEEQLASLIGRASALVASQVGGTNSGIALLSIAHGKRCYCATERLANSVRQEYQTDLVAPLSCLRPFDMEKALDSVPPPIQWSMERVASSTIAVYQEALAP